MAKKKDNNLNTTEDVKTKKTITEEVVAVEPTVEAVEETKPVVVEVIKVEEAKTEEVEETKVPKTEEVEETKVEPKSFKTAKDMFFENLNVVRHYELHFRNRKVYDTIFDEKVIPQPLDETILIGNAYYPYAGLSIKIK